MSEDEDHTLGLVVEAIYAALDAGHDESTVGDVVNESFKSWGPLELLGDE